MKSKLLNYRKQSRSKQSRRKQSINKKTNKVYVKRKRLMVGGVDLTQLSLYNVQRLFSIIESNIGIYQKRYNRPIM